VDRFEDRGSTPLASTFNLRVKASHRCPEFCRITRGPATKNAGFKTAAYQVELVAARPLLLGD